jgi:hypothetical protein
VTDFGLDTLDRLQAAQETGLPVPIYQPGTDKVLFNIHVAGPDSRQQARAVERNGEELAARGALTPLTREENEEANVKFLARCCTGWDLRHNDADVPFTEENAIELLTRYKLVREAVNRTTSDRAPFIKRSQTA